MYIIMQLILNYIFVIYCSVYIFCIIDFYFDAYLYSRLKLAPSLAKSCMPTLNEYVNK